MEELYLIIDGIIGLSLLILALVSLLKSGYKNSFNRLFAMFSALTAVWIVFNYLSGNIHIQQGFALVSNRITFAASFGVLMLLMQFIVQLANARRLKVFVDWLLLPLWLVCLSCFSPAIVKDVVAQEDTYSIVSGFLMPLYAVGIFLIAIILGYGLLHGLKYASGPQKKQLKTIGFGLSVSVPLILLIDFIIPMTTGIFSITEFGITPMIILVASLYYSVVKYKLFDIKLAAVRAAAYVLSLITLSIAYYGLAYLVSITIFKGKLSSEVSVSPINIALALILAFIFQPVKKFFDKITNKVFYSDRYDSDEFFARLNRTLSSTTDLRGLLRRTANEISSTLKADHAFFYINTTEGRYITVGTSDRRQLLLGDVREIQSVYGLDDGIIVASFLDPKDPIHRLMISHKIEIILPLAQTDHIIGYLCLGYHKNAGYKDRDLKVLETISDELDIAIQNALSIEEVRELNSTLQQRVEEATKELRASNAQLQRLDKVKDEFVSIASHQLRTPLTSVKGYISMVLEGDAGEINDNQRKLLDEAFNSSERMVHLIGDFLNVSRLQTGKFVIDKNPADLSKIVQEEVDGLQPSAISRNMKLVYKFPKNFPIIELDEGKFRQVIMNFADNAIYYSREGSTIEINLSVENNEAIYTVKDTGIGVPENEREQLFTKFYRASNAKRQRPDGTGVGLFLAKKIVDSHGGRIIFESVEGKGSTFGFRLPIK